MTVYQSNTTCDRSRVHVLLWASLGCLACILPTPDCLKLQGGLALSVISVFFTVCGGSCWLAHLAGGAWEHFVAGQAAGSAASAAAGPSRTPGEIVKMRGVNDVAALNK